MMIVWISVRMRKECNDLCVCGVLVVVVVVRGFVDTPFLGSLKEGKVCGLLCVVGERLVVRYLSFADFEGAATRFRLHSTPGH